MNNKKTDDINAGKVSAKALANCGRGGSAWNLLDLFVTRAFADEPCKVEVGNRTYTLSKVDVENCESLVGVLNSAKAPKEVRKQLKIIAEKLKIAGVKSGANQVLLMGDIYNLTKNPAGLRPAAAHGTIHSVSTQQDLLDALGEMDNADFTSAYRNARILVNQGTKIELIVKINKRLEERAERAFARAEALKNDDTIVGYHQKSGIPITAAEQALGEANTILTEIMLFNVFVPDTYEGAAWQIGTGGITTIAKYGKSLKRLTEIVKRLTEIVKSRKGGGAPTGKPTVNAGAGATNRGPNNVNSGIRLKHQLAAEEIAGGHGFQKHVLEQGEFAGLGIRTRKQYQSHIENVLNNPSSVRYTSDGRSFHLQESTGTVVIRNPKVSDGGTAFQPKNWKDYLTQIPTRTEPY